MRWIALAAGGVALAIAGATGLRALSKSTTWQAAGEIVARIDTDRPVVALTFDDGPSGRHTAEHLALLGDAWDTFYLVGKDVVTRPGAAAAIVAAGHEVGNHSYTHERMVLRPAAEMIAEIRATDAGLFGADAASVPTFRPPFGSKGVAVPRYFAE
ncbi:MAG: polysaccharide deacetylase family protein [Shimia sp.]